MKLHRHLVEQVITAVFEIFSTRKPADKVLERFLKSQKKWGARDRRFFAESCYEMVRHWRSLWVRAGLPADEYLNADKLTSQRVWQVWAFFEQNRGGELPPWNELKNLRFPAMTLASLPRAVRESVPDWLDELGAKEFGAEWDAVLAALNRPADVFLRVNRLKADPATVINRLADEGVDAEVVPGLPDALRLPVRKNVFITKSFRDGLFEVQDAASQTVAPMLQPEPGQRVIDACAGAGGKSLHLAALMHNKGKVLSLDIHQWKLDALRERASRNGVNIVETRVIESTKTIKRLEASADRVLLDVPCSGLGVLRRNPDTKWKLEAGEITRLRTLQSELLSSYSRMLKPGGLLVYATCSLLPEENERQVKAFLESDQGKLWSLEEQLHHRPDREGYDGFFAARLRRLS